MDYTNRPLSTEWMVVMNRSIQDRLHTQAINYRIGGGDEQINCLPITVQKGNADD